MARFLIALALAACSFSAGAQDYEIRPGDTLAISVLEDPSLDRQVLVRPDGRISLPLAGTLEAAGNSPEVLRDRIVAALSRDFITPPSVTVSLIGTSLEVPEIADVYLIGAVARPGRYDMPAPVSVLQALATAGGLSPFAASDDIQVRRFDGSGREVVYIFDFEAVLDGAVPGNAFTLSPGDVIVVPERGLFD
jgi:polysaccharide export outer membrane protein